MTTPERRPPLAHDGGQAWYVAASTAERWALTRVMLHVAVQDKIPAAEIRKHRRLKSSLRIDHIVTCMNKNNGVSSKRAIDVDDWSVYTLTAENLEWLEKLIALVPVDTATPRGMQQKGELLGSEALILVDELLERAQNAKNGTYTVGEEIPLWNADVDNWVPEPRSTTSAVCPKCIQVSEISERKVVCPSCKAESLPDKWVAAPLEKTET